MPFMSTQDLNLMASAITSRDAKIDKVAKKAEAALVTNKALVVGEALVGAGGFGYLRGTYEDPTTGAWNIPGTTVDIQAVVVAGLAAVALGGVYWKPIAPYAGHAANVAAGIGGHYVGQVSRKYARSGKFSTIAGVPGIGALPQYDPNSYDPTQYSAPYSDPVAASLASAGV